MTMKKEQSHAHMPKSDHDASFKRRQTMRVKKREVKEMTREMKERTRVKVCELIQEHVIPFLLLLLT